MLLQMLHTLFALHAKVPVRAKSQSDSEQSQLQVSGERMLAMMEWD